MSLKKESRQIECAVKPLMSHYIADQRVDLAFHDFPPFGIVAFTESAVLTGACGSLLQLRACRLVYPANATNTEFR